MAPSASVACDGSHGNRPFLSGRRIYDCRHVYTILKGAMTDTDNIIVDTTQRMFRDLADPQTLNLAADDGWKDVLWTALEESGLTLAWVPDDLGGAGAGMDDGFQVLRVAGAHAVAVPLAETLLAGWLLARAGIASPAGRMSVASGLSLANGKLSGTARGVPMAADCAHLAVLADGPDGPHVVLVETSSCQLDVSPGLAGDGMATVTMEDVTPVAMAAASNRVSAEDLSLMGAAVRAHQMAGALEAVLGVAVDYAKERQAFGKPIAKFQAVQHGLARLAGETAAATAAAGSAADTLHNAETFDDAVFLEVASAKIRAGEAAGEGAAIAHQVLGAIGFTEEHVLQRYTRRLWAWRDDFGSESEWALKLGQRIAAGGADDLWPLVASR